MPAALSGLSGLTAIIAPGGGTGGGTPPAMPSLNFSVATNSMYLVLLFMGAL